MIRFYKSVLTESLLDSPFVPKEKNLWFLDDIMNIIANENTNDANLDIATLNMASQKETNELNAELQREANEQNYRMFLEQNAFTEDMWRKQNAYNEPRKQVERLLAAGINPAGVQANQASSVSSSSAPSAHAAHMNAPVLDYRAVSPNFSGFGQSVGNAINAYNESRLAQAEIKNKDALTANTAMDTSYKSKALMDSVKMLQEQAKGEGFRSEIAKRQLAFIEATQQYDIDLRFGDYQMQQKSMERLQKELDNMQLQNDILEITKGYANQLNRAQVASLWAGVHQSNAQIGLINANKMLTDEQRLHEIEKKVSTVIDNQMKNVDLGVKKAVKQSLIQHYKNEANIGMAKAFDSWKYNPHGDSRSPSDVFQMDNIYDVMKRKFQRVGYIPKF